MTMRTQLLNPKYISLGTADIYIAPASLYLNEYGPQLIHSKVYYKGLAEEVGIEASSSISLFKPCNELHATYASLESSSFNLYMRSIEMSPDLFKIALGQLPDTEVTTIDLGTNEYANLRVEVKSKFPTEGNYLVGVFPNMSVNPNFNPRLTPTAEAVFETQFMAKGVSNYGSESITEIWKNSPLGYFKYDADGV